MTLSIEDAYDLMRNIDDVIMYLTDNSCGDEECCGGPLVSYEDFTEARDALKQLGIEINA